MDISESVKRCRKCLLEFSREAFGSHRTWCRTCFNAYARERSRRLSDGGYRRRPSLAMRYSQIKASARNRGHSFTLTREDAAVLWEQPCHYCGGLIANGLGLDRIANARGYELGNVVPCCGLCNAWKVDLSQAAFKEHITRLYQHFILGRPQLPLLPVGRGVPGTAGRPRR